MPRTAAALRRSWPGLLAQPDPLIQPPQGRRCPPVERAQQRHQRRDEQRADDRSVDQHRQRRADPDSLMNTISDTANAPIATANNTAAEVTRRPVRSRPIATASELLAPPS
jgi:hypothetical protein